MPRTAILARLLLAFVPVLAPVDASAQARKVDAPPVDQERIDAAIERGAEFLRQRVPRFGPAFPSSELVVYTLLHAGVPIDDPVLAEGIAWVSSLDVERLEFKERTYRVAVAAMTLEALNAPLYRGRIAQFAQFLVCNQCENGQWSYGENIRLPAHLKTPRVVESGPGGARPPAAGGERASRALIPVRCPDPVGPRDGDFSNTQFALLGLRACAAAGFDIPAETWKKAERILEQGQHSDGGWGYQVRSKPVGTAPAPQGAGGAGERRPPDESYGSMTCSGVCGLIIAKHHLGEDSRRDRRVIKGLEWIADHFTVQANPRAGKSAKGGAAPGDSQWHYYYLYSLERAGILAGVEQFGVRPWYAEGALWLLAAQEDDGAWRGDRGPGFDDTCFAILFLRRATQPIVPVRRTSR